MSGRSRGQREVVETSTDGEARIIINSPEDLQAGLNRLTFEPVRRSSPDPPEVGPDVFAVALQHTAERDEARRNLDEQVAARAAADSAANAALARAVRERRAQISIHSTVVVDGIRHKMIALRRFSARPAQVPARKNNAPPLMDVIVGYFISGCCLLLAVDVAHNSYPAALFCVLSAIVAAAAVPIGRRRRPRRRSTVTAADLAPRTNEANAVEQQNFYAGG
jgi:hypothetical protein